MLETLRPAPGLRHAFVRRLGPRPWIPLFLVGSVLSAVFAWRCGGNGQEPLPLSGLREHEFVFLPIDSTVCKDGTTAGLRVSLGSEDLLLLLDGGRVCSDFRSCCELVCCSEDSALPGRAHPASLGRTPGPLPSLLDSWDDRDHTGTILDRTDPENVFRDFTFVGIEMCTADFHAGNTVVTYRSGERTITVHHEGHANLVKLLDRVARTWPHPRRLVVVGVSGGGFGALLNYDTIRGYWPGSPAFLIDDSGPALAGHPLPGGWSDVPDAWVRWNVESTLGGICPECAHDLSAIYPALARRYPNDRKSLLSHLEDPRIEEAYGAAPDAAGWLAEALDRTKPVLDSSQWKWFFAPESGHVLVVPEDAGVPGQYGRPRPAPQTSAGVSLQTFLRKQITDDPSWSSVAPESP